MSTAKDSQPPILKATNLMKAYGRHPVLKGISLSIGSAERIALMGPSGSGKSTLLNCLGGIDRPNEGSIEIDGQRLETLDEAGLDAVRRSITGTIFQFFHLLPTMTVAENIELPMQLNAVRADDRAARVEALLDDVGLAGRGGSLPSQLSGGEMQRVAIARALAARPKLIFADEPTGNLDSTTGGQILDLIERLAGEHGTAILLVTHSDEATRICGRVLHMRDGIIDEAVTA